MTKLVIVESPTKARTIRDYLPNEYVVMASMGHVRDLPSSASEIPKAQRDEPWARLGVNVDEGFEPLYVITANRKETYKQLKEALAKADELIIATDEDREGESIGWHLVQVLKPKVPVKRMVFHEITRPAIQEALAHTRSVDENVVRAQETRRILDRLVGYTLSPLLWRKIAAKLSAGRVQSVAVRLLVERERERHAFRSGSYWDVTADVATRPGGEAFSATLTSIDQQRVATGKDFDDTTGRLAADASVRLLSEADARALCTRLADATWQVGAVETRSTVRKPYPPFTTSTLQQEAGRKLRLSARETMRIAQDLYENGYITYHRTDSVNLSEEAIDAARNRVKVLYGADHLSPKPRRFKTQAKAAQEAHEAIRPSGSEMRPVADLPLSGREAQVYDLIWKRAVATQMADAELEFVTADVKAADAVFRARGRRVVFAGFFRAYVEGSDDPDAAIEDRDAPLPKLTTGDPLDLQDLSPGGHETQPPGRFTEAALVKALEAAGVGRPSTYATILGTIQDRGYVRKSGTTLLPTFTAFAVTGLLETDFKQLVDLGFTAEMEEDLDRIAAGEVDWQAYLSRFYKGEAGLAAQVEAAQGRIDPRRASTVQLGDIAVRIGRYGPFVEIGEGEGRTTVALPEDMAPGDLSQAVLDALVVKGGEGPSSLGDDPDTGLPVFLRDGPYGPYVQLGDADGEKPKRVSLPKGLAAADVDLVTALALLALPRALGDHPETGKPVRAGVGRFGPYVVHETTFASLKPTDDVLTVELDRALQLLTEKESRGPGRSGAATVLRELGVHPETGEPLQILDGRYGPYVKYQRINASLPKDADVAAVTMDEVLALLAAKGSAPKAKRRTATRRKAG